VTASLPTKVSERRGCDGRQMCQSSCSVRFRYLEEGTFFRIDADAALKSSNVLRSEYFWLCHCCSENMTLRLDGEAGIRVALLADPVECATDFVLLDRREGLVLSSIHFDGRRTRKGRSRRALANKRDFLSDQT
jgi:hypothetical protein